MEYIKAPTNGSISRRILFGHLLGLGFRHSSIGSTGFCGPGNSDMHVRDVCNWRLLRHRRRNACRVAQLCESSRALGMRKAGRSGSMTGNCVRRGY